MDCGEKASIGVDRLCRYRFRIWLLRRRVSSHEYGLSRFTSPSSMIRVIDRLASLVVIVALPFPHQSYLRLTRPQTSLSASSLTNESRDLPDRTSSGHLLLLMALRHRLPRLMSTLRDHLCSLNSPRPHILGHSFLKHQLLSPSSPLLQHLAHDLNSRRPRVLGRNSPRLKLDSSIPNPQAVGPSSPYLRA